MASKQQLRDAWYDFIFKSPEHARKWIPILEDQRKRISPGKYLQSVSKLSLMDFDAVFACDPEPYIFAAGFENSEGDEITLDEVKKQMFQISDGNLNFVATCKCGYLTGNYHLGSKCPKCGSVCRNNFADEVNFGGWLVIPTEMPGFLHPGFYRVLRKWMGKIFKQNVYLLDGLLDPSVELPEEYSSRVGQGMAYFERNFDDVINYVASLRKGQKSIDNEEVLKFCKEWRHCAFVHHIPVLNQSLHVVTQSGTMQYNDASSEHILQTYLELSNTIHAQRHRSDLKPEYLAQRYWSIFQSWMNYVDTIIDPKLSGKQGFIRKNLLGHRCHASCRAVIAPITRNHNADEIELPWRMVVGVYKLEIMNILQNRYGKDVNEACAMFNNALVTYDPIIDTCLKTLQDECPFKGFPILMGRNPTLRHGEILLPLAA